MPFESEAQRRAMYAAAAGKSNIGIPKNVGEKFVRHGEDSITASVLLSPTEFKEDDTDPCWEGYQQFGMKEKNGKQVPNCVPEDDSQAWEKKEGKNKNGGLNEKGRESYNKTHGAHLKAPQPEGGSRKESFCARMKGMKQKLTSEETKRDPNSRINKSLKKWKCDDGTEWDNTKLKIEMMDLSEKLTAISQAIISLKEDEDSTVPRFGEQDCKVDALEPTPPAVEMPIDNQGGALGRASGIMFLTPEGETLLIRRGNGGDFPGTWAVPGGHQLPDGETLEEAARRECKEETGIDYKGELEVLYDDGQFCTYIAKNAKKEDVVLNYESTGYDWCSPANPDTPLHPGLDVAFKIALAKTEWDVAELMREGIMSSPQPYANMSLLAIRITGTGLAYRSSIGEHVWRDPSLYLNDEFVKRCNGLTVIMDHPETAVLTTEEFKNRAIGSIILPYIKGDEVWGIAKIYDNDAMKQIIEEGNSPAGISTSPSVVFDNTAGNTTLTTEDGSPLLIEGVPFLLDHIAIVTKARGSKGVWDKGGEAAGVLLTNPEVSTMNDESRSEPKADAAGDKLDMILQAISSISARVDSMEKHMPAPPLVTAADKKKRKDDDEDMRKDDDDEEEEMKKDDDMKHRKDSKRRDAEGSNPVEHKEGEIKPDDDEEETAHDKKMKAEEMAKKDDDEEEMAKKMDEEAAMYADTQAKCDSVLAAFGKSASRPLQGESLLAYRKRLLRGLQAYSDSYKDINLNVIKDSKLLDLAEKQIFADAIGASKAEHNMPSGQLIEINERDRAGRTITKFKGSMSAWLDDFKVPPMRATAFHTSNNQR